MTPLYQYMLDNGYDCVEVTPYTSSNMLHDIHNCKNRDVVLIVNDHFIHDEAYLEKRDGVFSNALSLLEAIDILKPVSSVYYPHDLAYILHFVDMPWMSSVFDLLLFPFDGFAHTGYLGAEVYNVGWIKKHSKLSGGKRFQVGHALGSTNWMRLFGGGAEGYYERFASIWNQGVIVKAHENFAQEYSSVFKLHGITEFNSKDSVFKLIDNCEIMLCDNTSSVHYESALSGRFTISVLEGATSLEEHENSLHGLPNLQIKTIEETDELLKTYYKGDFVPIQGEDKLKPFDFELAVKLITKR